MSFITKQPENLEQIKERLELVLSCANVGMWDWNPQTNEVVFDDRWAEMLGLAPDELSQTLEDWSSRVHPNDLQSCFDDIAAHIVGTTPFYQNTHRMRHKNGSWIYILDQGRVVEFDDAGQAIRFTGTHTDVTAIIESQRKASEALEIRDLFFAQISHDIRTPLHGILGAASVLKDANLDQKGHKLLEVVLNRTSKLSRLIDDILDIAKINAGGIETVIETTDVKNNVRLCFDQHRLFAQQKGLDFELTEKGLLPAFCETDSLRLSQILDNLISNAIKYTLEGSVKVTVDRRAESLHVLVKDTGVGIQDMQRAFENFTRENILNAKGSSGLGLGIVKMLCDLLNITLNVDTKIGEGSCFELILHHLSRQSDIDAYQLQLYQKEPLTDLSSTKRCLLIDDDEINILVGTHLLEKYFNEVCVARSGQEAIDQVVSNNEFDVLFIDLNLPDMRGEQIVERLKKMLHTDPVYICQSAEIEFSKLLDESDFHAFLPKPYGNNDVSLLLRNLNIH